MLLNGISYCLLVVYCLVFCNFNFMPCFYNVKNNDFMAPEK